MFMNGMSFRGRFCAALAGAGLLLTQLATAGQPALLVFGGKPILTPDYRIEWSQEGPNPVGKGGYEIKGRLLQRTGSPNKGNTPLYKPVPDAKIKISYSKKDKNGDTSTLEKTYWSDPTSQKPTTEGEFVAEFTSPDAPDGGIELKAAYYGKANELDGAPLAEATKELKKHLELVVLDDDGNDGDPDTNPADIKGTYKLKPKMLGWNDELLPSGQITIAEAKDAPLPPTHPNRTDIKINSTTVTHTGEIAGVAAVQAVAEGLKSEPVWLAFGADASLERVGLHKHEEIILQRPYEYNADHGKMEEQTVSRGTQFFMKEHAQLQLTLTSLLTGEPLRGVDVTWSTLPYPSNMKVFRSITVDDSETISVPTNQDGIASTPVSARHANEDKVDGKVPGKTDGVGEKPVYETAAGVATVKAEFKGSQIAQVDVPFIDSLWVIAKPTEIPRVQPGKVIDLKFDVHGYVGTDGNKQAKRKFEGFNKEEQSVAGSSNGKGPIVFSMGDKATNDKAAVMPWGPQGPALAGLAATLLTADIKGQLLGKFKANEAAVPGIYVLHQNWPVRVSIKKPSWWGQVGATLKLPGDGLLKIEVVK